MYVCMYLGMYVCRMLQEIAKSFFVTSGCMDGGRGGVLSPMSLSFPMSHIYFKTMFTLDYVQNHILTFLSSKRYRCLVWE